MPGGPWDVTPDDLAAWFAGLRVAANTYRSRRTTVRAFYRWAVLAGHVEASPAVAVPPGAVPMPNPRPVPDRVYQAALAAAGQRERLMLRLAAEHGLRRAEVAVIRPDRDVVEDLDGWSLIVHGKGQRERIVPLLDDVARQLRDLGPGYAFPGNDNGHLSPRWVGRLIADLLPEGWTMHKLRHRAGTKWWEASGRDLLVVQELLGHADPKTTRVYVKVNAGRLRSTVRGGAA